MSVTTKIFAVSEGVRIAIDSVRANKVRAGLTILGIAIGVFVVVAISAAVHGINNSVAGDLAAAGPNTFFVQRFPIVFENCDGSEDTCAWRRNPSISGARGAGPWTTVHRRSSGHAAQLVSCRQVSQHHLVLRFHRGVLRQLGTTERTGRVRRSRVY